MDIKQVRHDNLTFILKKMDVSKAEAARRIGTNSSYISQILSDKCSGTVGNVLARKIEKAFNLPPDWMDQRFKSEVPVYDESTLGDIDHAEPVRNVKLPFDCPREAFAFEVAPNTTLPCVPGMLLVLKPTDAPITERGKNLVAILSKDRDSVHFANAINDFDTISLKFRDSVLNFEEMLRERRILGQLTHMYWVPN